MSTPPLIIARRYGQQRVTVFPANILPSASISAPSSNTGYTAPASFTISGSASDIDGTISKIELYQKGNLLASFNSSSFNYTWSNVAKGDYTISARAIDNKGGVALSTINVKIVSSCNSIQWAANTAYVAGNEVSYLGVKYRANWWNYNERPELHNGPSGSGQPWTSLGACNMKLGVLSASNKINLYPNPVKENASLEFVSEISANATLIVSDMLSQPVLTKEIDVGSGNNTVRLELGDVSNGVYIITIANGEDKIVKQMVVNK